MWLSEIRKKTWHAKQMNKANSHLQRAAELAFGPLRHGRRRHRLPNFKSVPYKGFDLHEPPKTYCIRSFWNPTASQSKHIVKTAAEFKINGVVHDGDFGFTVIVEITNHVSFSFSGNHEYQTNEKGSIAQIINLEEEDLGPVEVEAHPDVTIDDIARSSSNFPLIPFVTLPATPHGPLLLQRYPDVAGDVFLGDDPWFIDETWENLKMLAAQLELNTHFAENLRRALPRI